MDSVAVDRGRGVDDGEGVGDVPMSGKPHPASASIIADSIRMRALT